VRWRRIAVIVLVAELATLTVEFGLPVVQHRIFTDPQFPHVIVFHQTPPSCIVDFQGNVYISSMTSTAFWTIVVIGVTFAVKLVRRNEESHRKSVYLKRS